MADYDKILAALSPEKRRLLEQKLREKAAVRNAFPLSFAQQRLWFLQELDPDGTAYNIPATVRLAGTLDVTALCAALQVVIDRHEILRTNFLTIENETVQLVAAQRELEFTLTDLAGKERGAAEAEAMRLIGIESQRLFKLSQGSLFRAHLYRIAPQEHLLLLAMHHIVADGWSVGLIIDELKQLYPALLQGALVELSPLPIQYADFSVWQKKWLTGDQLEAQLGFWRRQLEGAIGELALPFDRPRLAQRGQHGAAMELALPAGLVPEIKRFADESKVTPFIVFLAVLQLLLHRYSGDEDILVGTPIANRNRSQVEKLVGFFVNTLVLRTRIERTESFHDLLRRVRETALEAYAHQDLPFEMLVEQINPERNMNVTPIFQVMFTLQEQSFTTITMGDLTVTPFDAAITTAKFDLTFGVSYTPGGIIISAEYDLDLFEAGTIERMLASYQRLLAAAIAEPSAPVASLPVLAAAEQHKILSDWNETFDPDSIETTIQAIFENRARQHPESLAVTFAGESITYGELNRRANQLAHYLRRLGVGAETPVGLCFERSIEMIIGFVAILKSGGIYLPLAPDYPAERLAYIIETCDMRFLLTHSSLTQRITGPGRVNILLDKEWPVIAAESGVDPAAVNGPENLAYIIFTSGSTGKPKGVMIPHRGAINFWHGLCLNVPDLGSEPPVKISLNAPLLFDASIQQLLMLLGGHHLFIVPGEIRADAEAMVDFMVQHDLDAFECVPSQAKAILNTERWFRLEKLPRLMLIGGEAIDKESWEKMRRRPDVAFFNEYGPTECSIVATFWDLSREEAVLPTIGRPMAGARIYILDRDLQPVPPGVSGMIYIGGEGLARGYYQRPDLTAERFIPNPFSTAPGSRLYLTGDLGKYRSDGLIDYLGRGDGQVKIRGFRMELGEIEAVLQQQAQVLEAVVQTFRNQANELQLVAYVVFRPGEEATETELRSYMGARLPAYMIPALFMVLDQMPLTPNRKIDRRRLPVPDRTVTAPSGDYVAPRTAAEEMLAGLYAEVLSLPRVGARDDFFDLGGHSLLATRLITRIRHTFAIELPLRVLFEKPEVAELAQAITTLQRPGNLAEQAPIEPLSRAGRLPLSSAQQRLWFLDQLDPGSVLYNLPLSMRISGTLDLPALEQSFQRVVQRHESLRTSFVTEKGQPRLEIAPILTVNIALTDLSEMDEAVRRAELEVGMQREINRPFNLAALPLFRINIFKIAPEEHVLLLVMHHIISDGWSMNVMVAEVARTYEALVRGTVVRLPELPVQYADYAGWQQSRMHDDAMADHLAYWRGQLAGHPTVLELPADRPRPAVQTDHGAHHTFKISPELTAALNRLSREEGVTLFMTLLAAYQTWLYRYTRQESISVGTPVANRGRREIENLIGFFVNTLVLRTDLSGDPSFKQLLHRVRQVTLGAYAHQEMPFDKLVDALQPERHLDRTPLFQVMFSWHSADRKTLSLPGLTFTQLDPELNISPFDLTLIMEEAGDALFGAFEYNTDLFDAATVGRMTAHFKQLLENLCHQADAPISEAELMAAEESRQILDLWNDTTRMFPADVTLHRLFEEQAARTPEAVALVAAGVKTTYQELNRQANRLAHYLLQMGVGPGDRVGIALDRSREMIAGLLAILKSGAAYVPLDPDYPEERLEYMIRDARIEALLTTSVLAARLPAALCPIVAIDALGAGIAAMNPENPRALVAPGNPAYVIYTSGSTGQPKGVLVSHRSVVNHNTFIASRFGIGPQDNILQFFSISFDAAVEEIFPALISGATLTLRRDSLVTSIDEFLEMVDQEKITVLDLPTAYWHEWVLEMAIIQRPVPASVRLVIVGGEQASLERFNDWHERVNGHVHWVNTYGPTEGTIVATFYEPSNQPDGDGARMLIPIGRPIDNARIYILDRKWRQVPIGVYGELCIAGAGVAEGYLNRPELTAEKFIPDPYGAQRGGRLYRSGDLARYLPDGNIEFKGRVDQQLKIRGFRVEPGEIEAQLRQHPAVGECAVVAWAEDGQDKRLAAYMTARAGQPASVSDLREWLMQRLPPYMIPADFVWLEILPKSGSGKIDRKALPPPGPVEGAAASEGALPEGEREQKLADIFSRVLKRGMPGIDDNFFELGGDSILSIQVIALASQAGIQLTPKQLFQFPTIRGLARVAGTSRQIVAEQGEVTGEAPLTPIQAWFFEQRFPGQHHWNQSILLATSAEIDPHLLQASLQQLVNQHDVLRLRYDFSGEVRQSFAPVAEATSFTEIDLTELDEAQQVDRLAAIADSLQGSLDLSHGPIVRFAWFNLGPERGGRLLIVIHHLAVDGVSWRILFEDLQTVYSQLAAGMAVELPPKTTSFKYWAEQLREYAQSDLIDDEADYWLAEERFAVKPLPIDFIQFRELNVEASTENVVFMLDEAETTSLLTDATALHHVRINDLLLTALIQTLKRWTGAASWLIDVEGHGRETIFAEVDLSRTVGWFTTVYPALLRSGEGTLVELLKSVKEQLNRIPGNGFGYGLLRYLNGQAERRRRLAEAPQAEISFNYLGQFGQGAEESQPFRIAAEAKGAEHAPQAPRTYLLDLTGAIIEERLQLTLTYNRQHYNRATVQMLADYYLEALRAILAFKEDSAGFEYTPEDFPMLKTDQKNLDKILAQVGKKK